MKFGHDMEDLDYFSSFSQVDKLSYLLHSSIFQYVHYYLWWIALNFFDRHSSERFFIVICNFHIFPFLARVYEFPEKQLKHLLSRSLFKRPSVPEDVCEIIFS
jgi:hypothetical protein